MKSLNNLSIDSVKSSKGKKYRLLADGTILDNTTGKLLGYITSRVELDYAWKLGSTALQGFLKNYL